MSLIGTLAKKFGSSLAKKTSRGEAKEALKARFKRDGLSSNPEQRKRLLVLQLMKDEGITAADLVKNYQKGGIGTKKGKK